MVNYGSHRCRVRRPARSSLRGLQRRPLRRCGRCSVRSLPGFRRRPDELSQALIAFTRAISCHRRLARFAPSFFDSAVVESEARDRAERRRWMESWEPILAKYYGPPSASSASHASDPDTPCLPSRRKQRVVERELHGWRLWMDAGRTALKRYYRRRPHALPSFHQIVRLFRVAFAFARLASGLDSTKPPSEPLNYISCLEDLERAYGPRSTGFESPADPNPTRRR